MNQPSQPATIISLPVQPSAEPRRGRTCFDAETASPQEIIAWALRRFADRRLVTSTSFGMEGCALMDMLSRANASIEVLTIDTGFLFAETQDLRRQLERRYPTLHFRTLRPALTPAAQAALHGSSLWAEDGTACCRIRKEEPMAEALAGRDLWFTALRRSQSPTRSHLQIVEWNWRHELLKVNPLALWSRRDVWTYVQTHDVPYNPLHEQGYPSVGCTHCTAAVPGSTPESYSREGRWPGQARTECGLHLGEGI